jgi:hypothetical protein
VTALPRHPCCSRVSAVTRALSGFERRNLRCVALPVLPYICMRLCRMLAIVFDPAPPLPAYLKKPSGAVTSTAAAAGAAAGADDDDDDNAAADDFGGLPLSAAEATGLLGRFVASPVGFCFSAVDLQCWSTHTRTKHSLWFMDFANAQVAAARSQLTFAATYPSVVLQVECGGWRCDISIWFAHTSAHGAFRLWHACSLDRWPTGA